MLHEYFLDLLILMSPFNLILMFDVLPMMKINPDKVFLYINMVVEFNFLIP